MKKTLSVLLALVMVLMTATMLIPGAWAEPAPYVPEAKPAGSWDYYSQNFDDADLASLEDAALATALGWTAPGTTQTMMIEDGKLRYVSQYSTAAAYTATLISALDNRMLTSTTVIEYDMRMQRRTDAVTVNNGAKTVAADKQDGKNMVVSVDMGNNSGLIYATRFPAVGDINLKAMKGTGKTYQAGNLSLAMKNSVDKVNNIPEGTTDVTLDSNGPSKRVGVDYHVKAVYNPVEGMYYLELNGVVVSKVSAQDNYAGSIRLLAENILSQFVLSLSRGMDVLLDNLQIYGYYPTPALVITEVAPNGAGVNAAGALKKGAYQWVEVYNPNATSVNVYDYALHVNNDPTKATTVFGANADGAVVGRGSALGYLKPGTQTFTLANETTSTFENPAYDAGVLGAGESAILILPEALHAGNVALDQAQIKTQLAKLGMPEGTKLFVCDNYDEYPLVLSSAGAMTLGLMKVSNPGTEEVAGLYEGTNDEALMLLESYVILTSDKSNEGNVALYEGFAMNSGATCYIPAESALNLSKRSVEIGYWNMSGAGTSTVLGLMKTNATALRMMGNGENGYASPGYIGEAYRSNVTFRLTDAATGASSNVTAPFMSSWKMANEEKDGYKFLGYRAAGSDVYSESVYVFEAGAEIVADYVRMAPSYIGYQVSELTDGTYSVRLLGGIQHKDLEAVGFTYSYTYTNEHGKRIEVKDQTYSCEYVYTAVTVDGDVKTAEELGYAYVYALHIDNIPEAVGSIEFKVSAFTVESKFQNAPVYHPEAALYAFTATAPAPAPAPVG